MFAGAPPTASDRFIALAVQGELQAAGDMLEREAALPGSTANELAADFRERFGADSVPIMPDTGSLSADQAIMAYRDYWAAVLAGRKDAGDAETKLAGRLADLSGTGRAGPGAIPAMVGHIMQSAGLHYLESFAPPVRDLFVWRSEEKRTFTVELTDREMEVPVVFMSDFYSQGWKEYASLGLATTTGWVEDGRLYCLVWAYTPGTENFEVSYLKHEARHLADFEQFPDLSATELEYRAKLTELAYARTTLPRILRDFSLKRADNPRSPHAFANYRVTREIWQALYGQPFRGKPEDWEQVSVAQVNRLARRLLQRDTATHEKAGARPDGPNRAITSSASEKSG